MRTGQTDLFAFIDGRRDSCGDSCPPLNDLRGPTISCIGLFPPHCYGKLIGQVAARKAQYKGVWQLYGASGASGGPMAVAS